MSAPIKLVTEVDADNAKVVETLEKALARAKQGDLREVLVTTSNGEQVHTWWHGSELRLTALTSRATHVLHRRNDVEQGDR